MKYVYAVIMIVVIGIIIGLLLALSDKYFKVEEDPRKDDIMKILPGINCGACGFPGCAGLADAMVEGSEKSAKACKSIKADKGAELQNYLDNMKG